MANHDPYMLPKGCWGVHGIAMTKKTYEYDLAAMREQGMTVREIAIASGLPKSTVWNRLRRAGVCTRTRRRNSARNMQIFRDRQAGATYRELSYKYGMSIGRLHHIVEGVRGDILDGRLP